MATGENMCALDKNAVRVLVAEDNYALANVLRFNLQRTGIDVTVANDGTQAIEFLKRKVFDLLITDFQMPGANGEQLCRVTRQDLHLEDLPIVMCSAKGFELDIQRLKSEYKISEILYKPFSIQAILKLVQNLVASKYSCSEL